MRNLLKKGYPFIDNKETTGNREKILVIENDRSAARLAEYTLGMGGYEVIVAYDGSDGINKVVSEQPDLIILDVVTPAIDGYEICGHLWDRYESARIPILVITSKTPEKGCIIREKIGVDNYMVKPVEPVEMLDKVALLLHRSAGKRRYKKHISRRQDDKVLQTVNV